MPKIRNFPPSDPEMKIFMPKTQFPGKFSRIPIFSGRKLNFSPTRASRRVGENLISAAKNWIRENLPGNWVFGMFCSSLRKRFRSERSERGSEIYLLQTAKKGAEIVETAAFWIKIVRRRFSAFCSELASEPAKCDQENRRERADSKLFLSAAICSRDSAAILRANQQNLLDADCEEGYN